MFVGKKSLWAVDCLSAVNLFDLWNVCGESVCGEGVSVEWECLWSGGVEVSLERGCIHSVQGVLLEYELWCRNRASLCKTSAY